MTYFMFMRPFRYGDLGLPSGMTTGEQFSDARRKRKLKKDKRRKEEEELLIIIKLMGDK